MNENLFSQSYDQIVAQVIGGSNAYFQMLGAPQDFNWPVAPAGQLSRNAFQFMNSVPMWSPIGTFNTAASTFYSNYRQVLGNVTYKTSPDKQRALLQAQDQLTKAQNTWSAAKQNLNQQYLYDKSQGGVVFEAEYPTITDWLNSNDAQPLKIDIEVKNTIYQKALDHYNEQAASDLSTDLTDMLNASKLPIGDPAKSEPPRGWTKVEDGSGRLQWQPDYVIGTTGQDWRAQLEGGSIGAKEITLRASDSTNKLTQSWAGGTSGYNTFFWGVSGSGGWSEMNLSQSDKSVEATIKLKSSTVVQITPGAWYDGGFMSNLAKGQGGNSYQITSPWVAKGSKNSLFGQDGLLGTQCSGLVVVYQPSFEVKMSTATYDKNVQKFEAGGGFRIGPFNFGGSGGHTDTYEHTTSGGTTFKGGSTSDDPLIIGVIVGFPGFGTPNNN